jgi:acyl-CoA oxidase
VIGIADPGFWTRFGVAYGLFLGAIRGGATPNQLSESFLAFSRRGIDSW